MDMDVIYGQDETSKLDPSYAACREVAHQIMMRCAGLPAVETEEEFAERCKPVHEQADSILRSLEQFFGFGTGVLSR